MVGTLQFGQLHRAVNTGHLCFIVNFVAYHRHAVGHGKLDDVGQVVLALGVLVVQPGQPRLQAGGGHRHDAAVDFPDLALRIRGVFLLDDGHDGQVVKFPAGAVARVRNGVSRGGCAASHDAPITTRVGELQRQQCQLVAATSSNQLAQGIWLGQRHIARQHHDDPIARQRWHRLLHGVASA